MSVAVESPTYVDLLREYAPSVPTTDEEHRKLADLLGRYLAREEQSLSEDEQKFVATLAALVAEYERARFRTSGLSQ